MDINVIKSGALGFKQVLIFNSVTAAFFVKAESEYRIPRVACSTFRATKLPPIKLPSSVDVLASLV